MNDYKQGALFEYDWVTMAILNGITLNTAKIEIIESMESRDMYHQYCVTLRFWGRRQQTRNKKAI